MPTNQFGGEKPASARSLFGNNTQNGRGPWPSPIARRLSDGSLVEWIGDPINPGRIRLLVWKDGRGTVQDEIEDNQEIFRAPAFSHSLAKALYVPTEVQPGGTAKERLNDIVSVLRGHIHFADEDHYLLAAAFALSTWFPERLDVFPYLVITGPTGSGKSTLLQLLKCFCRRPILVGDISTAALYRTVDQVAPTLLLDEFDDSQGNRALRRLLRMGNTPGEYVARAGELFDGSCAKVFCVTEPIEDVALSTRAIHIALLPSNTGPEPVDQEMLRRIAAEQQPKLLGFRLENLDVVRSSASTPGIETFCPKLRDVARALLFPLSGDGHLELALIQAFETQDEEASLDRRNEPSWHVVKTLFSYCHPAQAGEVTVGTFAVEVNRLRMEAGEGRRFTARKVGAILKVLRVKTVCLGSAGRGIELTPQFRRQVHSLARQFGVTRRHILNWMTVKGGYGGPACDLCVEFDLTAELRPSPPQKKEPGHSRLFSKRDDTADAKR